MCIRNGFRGTEGVGIPAILGWGFDSAGFA